MGEEPFLSFWILELLKLCMPQRRYILIGWLSAKLGAGRAWGGVTPCFVEVLEAQNAWCWSLNVRRSEGVVSRLALLSF